MPYPTAKAKITPPIIKLKLDSNKLVSIPACFKAAMITIIKKKEKTILPSSLPDSIFNDLQTLTTVFFKASAIIIPTKIMIAATINLGIRLTKDVTMSVKAFMPKIAVESVANIKRI